MTLLYVHRRAYLSQVPLAKMRRQYNFYYKFICQVDFYVIVHILVDNLASKFIIFTFKSMFKVIFLSFYDIFQLIRLITFFLMNYYSFRNCSHELIHVTLNRIQLPFCYKKHSMSENLVKLD